MFQRLAFTAATAVSLTGLYVLYSFAMKPVIVIPNRQQTEAIDYPQPTKAELPAENVRIAETYLAQEKWPAKAGHMLHFDQSFVYTNDWHQHEDSKSVTFIPFAMVLVSVNKEGQEEAVSMVSDSAQLEFVLPFDERNTNPGRVIGARMNGNVQITGANGLAVKGQDFIFDEGTLSLATWKPVRFWFQSHSGSAARMWMKLLPSVGTPRLDRPLIGGMESVQLIADESHKVNLKVQMPQGDKTVPVYVRSTGDLLYTFANNTAVLTREVVAGTNTDWLECDTLTLRFTPKQKVNVDPAKSAESSTTKPSEFQKPETDLEFTSLEAVEGKEPVQVKSRTQNATATMTHLTYNAQTRHLSMKSNKPKTSVHVKRKGSNPNAAKSELLSTQIDAQFDEHNSPQSLLCLGIGQLVYVDDLTGQSKFVASWEKRLSKTTDQATGLDLIELDKKATFAQPEQKTGLAADAIKIWLKPMSWQFNPNLSNDDRDEQPKTPDPEPKRLVAVGDVSLLSPQMQIKRTHELEVRFEDPDDPRSATRQQKSRSQLQLAQLTVPVRRSADQPQAARRASPPKAVNNSKQRQKSNQIGFANIPAEPDRSLGPPVEISDDSPKPLRGKKPKKPADEPFIVSAERIFARVQRTAAGSKTGEPELSVQEVLGDGKVLITQKRKPGEKDLRLEGNRVHLQGAEADKRQVIHVVGIPALIHDQGFKIEGRDIHLDRGANRAWVSGSGDLTLPIPEDANIPSDARELHVHWDESMEFDGADAKFVRGVVARLGLGKMKCEQMLVQLAERLSFQQETFDTNPELKTIYCRENVRFENSTYVGKTRTEAYRGEVGEFHLNYLTKDVKAQGPGKILAWRRKIKGDDGGSTGRDAIQANRPLTTEITTWEFTQVEFEGTLDAVIGGKTPGFPTRQRVTIEDRVQVIYGPVDRAPDVVDPENLPSMGGTLRCDQLEITNHPGSNKSDKDYQQLIGRGNAEVDGQVNNQRFTAAATEISFDGSNTLYTLRSLGRQNARLTGVGVGNQSGRTIIFNPDPEKRILRVDGAGYGQGQISQ